MTWEFFFLLKLEFNETTDVDSFCIFSLFFFLLMFSGKLKIQVKKDIEQPQ